MEPSVAIVILNWNGRHYLQQFLPSVLNTAYSNYKVVVADNASTDDSIQYLQQHYPLVEIIRLPENYGFSIGYNKALKQVNAEYYVLLNSDVEVTPNWLQPLVACMQQNQEVAACQPKILMQQNKSSFEYAGAAGGWLDYLGYPFARGRVFDICEEDNGQYDKASKVFWASGAAMMVRATVYHQCGGLDEYYFAHMEEIDLCWRMQLAGYSIMVCPAAVVYHVGGGTLPKGNQRKVYLNFRNNLIMLCKNLPVAQLLWKLPFRFLLDAISAWKSLLAGQSNYFVAIFKAHLSFIKWILFSRNKSIFPVSRRGKLAGMLYSSVVWKHFVLGKTRFSEIVENKEG
ncbi:MAG: glycosyltransferase family 2 protein [Flavihumibacter sp.]|nr:glycosyltransferase family 2 protein [Flavihumibacter sp.]